jgi:quinol monooxygenase YgiN
MFVANAPARRRRLSWIAALLLVTPAFSDGADSRFIVTYLDVRPAAVPAVLATLRDRARRVGGESGASEALVLQEIGRSERLAVVQTWATQDALETHRKAAQDQLEERTALLSPPDERVGEPLSVGNTPQATPGAFYVLIHVDVLRASLPEADSWLAAQAEAARAAPGALRSDIWQQVDRSNHFTLIQVWADLHAYERFVDSASTKAFRARFLTVRGALYDERFYRPAPAR